MFYGPPTSTRALVLVSLFVRDTVNGEVLIITCNADALPSSDIPPDLFPTEDISVKTDLLKAVTYLSTNLSGNYMLWVNATTLVTVNFGPIGEGRLINEPLSSFPFGRMATTTPVGSRAFYLYHQLNGSILAEEVWDSGHLVWTSSNVSVAIT